MAHQVSEMAQPPTISSEQSITCISSAILCSQYAQDCMNTEEDKDAVRRPGVFSQGEATE